MVSESLKNHDPQYYTQQLESLILEQQPIMSILKTLQSVEPGAYIAAGII